MWITRNFHELAQKYFDLSFLSEEDKPVILLAVKYHTKQYPGKDQRILLFNKIIMAADAYANVNNIATGEQPMTKTASGHNQKMIDDFVNMRPVWAYPVETQVDRAIQLSASLYYVRYDFLRKSILDFNLFEKVTMVLLSKIENNNDKETYEDAMDKMKKNYLTKEINY